MERDRKQDILDLSGLISTHLETDTVQMENRGLQTRADIDKLEETLEDLQARMDVVLEDPEHEGLALSIMESYGRAINNLTLALAQLKQKRDVINLALVSVRAAAQELNNFGNSVVGIPTISNASASD